jgi:hypothetical protein
MAAHPELIFCGGKNPRFAAIAIAAGFRYGAQLPCTTYGPVYFADQDWKHPDRTAYMVALAEHRPVLATCLDWEREEQLSEVLSWAEEIAQWTQRVLIIPKVFSGIERLPRRINSKDVVLAYSVPTAYGGTQVPAWEFAGWPIHLLGGSPQAQMRIARYLDVVSVDGNMHQQQANKCRFWTATPGPKGHWRQLSSAGAGDWGEGSNYEAFRRSCDNILAAWEH